MKSKKYKIATLGCRTNQYESEAYRKGLEELGCQEAKDDEKADICIVNTCTVTSTADSKSLYQIRKFSRENENCTIFVTGCFAESRISDIIKIEGVKGVILNKNKSELLKIIFPEIEKLPEFSIERFTAHTRAFVKVQDGCNSYCSYCIIPFVRGRSRSRDINSIVNEIKTLVDNGYKEVVLTGINIGDFDGGDGKSRLSDLVKSVDNINGLSRIRISSIDPNEIDDSLIDIIINGDKTCKSMHVVLQSGSNSVLTRMNRKYTREEFCNSINKLKNKSVNFTFTTDLIVGFPGESDEDFEESMNIIKNVRFASVHIFPYSIRPKTRAARFTDKIAKNIIDNRMNEARAISEKAAHDLRDDYVGSKVKVLIENQLDNGNWCGRTDNFLEVQLIGDNLKCNNIVDVNIECNLRDMLIGKVL